MPGSHARYLRREMPSDISYSKLLCMRLALGRLSNISHVCKNPVSFLRPLIFHSFHSVSNNKILFHLSSHALRDVNPMRVAYKHTQKMQNREKMQRKLATLRPPRHQHSVQRSDNFPDSRREGLSRLCRNR